MNEPKTLKKPKPLPPYWADTHEELVPHIFKRRDSETIVISAERLWATLRENVKRLVKRD